MKKISIAVLALLLLVGCSSKPEPEPEPEPYVLKFTMGKGDVEYKLPVPYKTFKENGWILEGDESFEIPANSILETQGVRQDGYYMIATFYNDADSPQPLLNTQIVEIKVEDRTMFGHYKDDVAPNINVTPGIQWGFEEKDIATAFDVTPTVEENRVYKTYKFDFGDGSELFLQYIIEDNTLQYITVKDYGFIVED